ncbi:hypothetical protein [uncultured Cohaesibacter sp.]|uniref:hypothetical protein n=1 Tax=uncultured Cohaesibacter sp. TaxID=1002546 RepID=UPI002AA682E5|nr:hypothetical protein [uncultured Cohaesibacter sp.]
MTNVEFKHPNRKAEWGELGRVVAATLAAVFTAHFTAQENMMDRWKEKAVENFSEMPPLPSWTLDQDIAFHQAFGTIGLFLVAYIALRGVGSLFCHLIYALRPFGWINRACKRAKRLARQFTNIL